MVTFDESEVERERDVEDSTREVRPLSLLLSGAENDMKSYREDL